MFQILINLSLSLILIVMGVQDFKYRAISWFAFPLLAVLLLASNPTFDLLEGTLKLGFILLNYILATLMVSLRQKKLINLMDAHIGWGDVMMILCLMIYFPVLNFFVFYLVSLLLIAAGTGIYMLWKKPVAYTVPLAGLQSIMLFLLILVTWSTGTTAGNTAWIQAQPIFQFHSL